MKLQFNLLPDVKQQYLKTQHTKRTVIGAALAASAVALFIFLFMLITVDVVNKKQLSEANSNITKYTNQLKSIPDLDKILTVQNQLQSVTTLQQTKHVTSRLYQYLPQITPTNVCLSQATMDLTANSLNLNGSTDSLKSVNSFIDTLKFTKYKISGQNSEATAFPTVTESSFGLISANSTTTTCAGKPALANYQLTISFDPNLFSNAQKVTLDVPPGLTTTRSVLDDPGNPLFTGQSNSTQSSQTGGH